MGVRSRKQVGERAQVRQTVIGRHLQTASDVFRFGEPVVVALIFRSETPDPYEAEDIDVSRTACFDSAPPVTGPFTGRGVVVLATI